MCWQRMSKVKAKQSQSEANAKLKLKLTMDCKLAFSRFRSRICFLASLKPSELFCSADKSLTRIIFPHIQFNKPTKLDLPEIEVSRLPSPDRGSGPQLLCAGQSPGPGSVRRPPAPWGSTPGPSGGLPSSPPLAGWAARQTCWRGTGSAGWHWCLPSSR